MAEYIFNGQSNLVWGETFKMGGKTPAIANRIFDTYANALAFANDVSAKGTSIPGLVLSVFNDPEDKKNGVYRIVSVATGIGNDDAVIEKIGEGTGSITASNYTAACELATADNLGQLIYTINKEPQLDPESGEQKTDPETGEPLWYAAGPYIVIGAGEVSKLGTTSATGDIQGDVEDLKGDVGTLNAEVSGLTNDVDELQTAVSGIAADVEILLGDADIEGSVDNKIASALTEYAKSADTINAIEAAKEEAIAESSAYTDSAIETALADYATSADTVAAIEAAVDLAGEYIDKKFEDYATSADTVAAIEKAIEDSAVLVEKLETAEEGFAATYVVKQAGEQVGATINIPKDFLVKSAEIKVCEADDEPVEGFKEGDKYIDFVVNAVDESETESHIYLNVKDLVDVYTGSDYIEIGEDNVISLKLEDLKSELDIANLSGTVKDLVDVVYGTEEVSGLTQKVEAIEEAMGEGGSVSEQIAGAISAFSADVQSALDEKVDTEEGKSLVDDELIEKLEGIESGAQVNVIETLEVNGVAAIVEDKKASVTIGAEDIEYNNSGMTQSIDNVLRGIFDRLNGIESSALTASESGITISDNVITLKLEETTDETVEEGHIEMKFNESGELYGQMYWIDGDTEE